MSKTFSDSRASISVSALVSVSWKSKLIALIIVTLLGLFILTYSAYLGLGSITAGYGERQRAESYRRQSLVFANDLLQLERSSNTLALSQLDGFLGGLNSVVEQSKELESSVTDLGQPRLTELASTLSLKMASYQTMKSEWVQLNKEVGFSNQEGAWADIDDKGRELDGLVKLEQIAKPIDSVVANQRNWLNTREASFAKGLETSLTVLEGVVEEMKWQNIVIGKTVAAYRSAFDPLKRLVGHINDVNEQNQKLLKEVEEIIVQQSRLLDEVVVVEAIAKADDSRRFAVTTVVAAAVVVGLVLMFTLAAITTQLNLRLGRMGRLFNKVAEGDLSETLKLGQNKKDEFNKLGHTTNMMIHDISQVVGRVVEGSQSLLNVRDELTQVSEQLANGSALVEEETELSTEATQQISIAVNDVAKRTSEVRDSIRTVTESTRAGVKATEDSMESMKQIAELIDSTNKQVQELSNSSTEMEGIIDVINSLAGQTNLLALNAAIESARAGEAGRGFAVVADEVRALAKKTVSATANIGKIISDFNERAERMSVLMERGVSVVQTGELNAANVSTVFVQINDSVGHVAEQVDQVAVSVEEISATTDGIATQMDQIYQHTTETKSVRETLVRHIADLNDQSERLVQASSRFRLSKVTIARSADPIPPRREQPEKG